MLLTATLEPLLVSVPFHTWVMVWPLGNVQLTVQPLSGAVPVFVTVTEPWKPPPQLLLVLYVALQRFYVSGLVAGALRG